MDAAGLRKRYTDLLFEKTREVQYPSRELMDRTERSLRDPEMGVEYVEMLLEKVQGRYPSLELLDRIDMAVLALELHEHTRRRWEAERSEHEE